MALELVYANSVDALARELADALGVTAATDPFASPLVVVPGRALSATVERRVAERLGIAMSIERIGLRKLWSRVAEAAGLCVVDARALAAEILARVPREPSLSAVQRWLDASPAEVRGTRGVEIATSLAQLLLEDDRERPSYVDAWLAGRAIDGPPAWQGALVGALFDADGLSRSGPWVLPSRAVRQSLARDAVLPALVHLFCPAAPTQGELDNLRRLTAGTDVRAYVLSPCRGFWEDFSPDDPPLLAELGRAGRLGIRAWNSLAAHDSSDAHVDREGPTVLSRVQAVVLDRARSEQPAPRADRSLTLHDCPSPAREAEIAKNLVLEAMVGPHAMQPTLRPDEVVVLVPEKLTDEYYSRLSRAFAAPPALPCTVIGRRLVETSPAAAAALALLAIPSAEITRDGLLAALAHPAVCAKIPGASPAGFRSLARRLGVLWGRDAGDLDGTYVTRDLFHWDQALSRLSLGFFADASAPIVEHGRGPWLTFPVAAEDRDVAFALLDTARRLLSDAAQLARAELPLGAWAKLLSVYLDTYLFDDERDVGRAACLDACATLAGLDVDGRAVSYPVATRWLTDALGDLEDPGGEPLFEGVAIGSLSALAAAPARLVVLVGALEATLPRVDAPHPLDVGEKLRERTAPRADQDRYAVLTRLADAERIAISWVGRDPATGETARPSPIVGDLRAALAELGDPSLVDALTRRHPVDRADASGFDAASPIPRPLARGVVVEANMRRIADALRDAGHVTTTLEEALARLDPGDRAKIERLLSVPVAPDAQAGARRVSLGVLRRFVERPFEAAAEWLAGGGDDEDDEDDEPLDGDALLRTTLLRPAFLRAGGDVARARLLRDEAYLRRELAAEAPTGIFGARERARQDQLLLAWASAVGEVSHHTEIVLGIATPLGERVLRRAPVALGDWSVYGVTPPLTHDLRASVALATSKKPSARHALPAALAMTLLAAAGDTLPSTHAITIAGTAQAARFLLDTPTRDEATTWLTHLIEDLASGPPPYLVTFGAAEAVKKASNADPARRISLAEAVDEETRRPLFAVRGPLARTDLALPDDALGRRLMQRRYDFLFERLRVA